MDPWKEDALRDYLIAETTWRIAHYPSHILQSSTEKTEAEIPTDGGSQSKTSWVWEDEKIEARMALVPTSWRFPSLPTEEALSRFSSVPGKDRIAPKSDGLSCPVKSEVAEGRDGTLVSSSGCIALKSCEDFSRWRRSRTALESSNVPKCACQLTAAYVKVFGQLPPCSKHAQHDAATDVDVPCCRLCTAGIARHFNALLQRSPPLLDRITPKDLTFIYWVLVSMFEVTLTVEDTVATTSSTGEKDNEEVGVGSASIKSGEPGTDFSQRQLKVTSTTSVSSPCTPSSGTQVWNFELKLPTKKSRSRDALLFALKNYYFGLLLHHQTHQQRPSTATSFSSLSVALPQQQHESPPAATRSSSRTQLIGTQNSKVAADREGLLGRRGQDQESQSQKQQPTSLRVRRAGDLRESRQGKLHRTEESRSEVDHVPVVVSVVRESEDKPIPQRLKQQDRDGRRARPHSSPIFVDSRDSKRQPPPQQQQSWEASIVSSPVISPPPPSVAAVPLFGASTLVAQLVESLSTTTTTTNGDSVPRVLRALDAFEHVGCRGRGGSTRRSLNDGSVLLEEEGKGAKVEEEDKGAKGEEELESSPADRCGCRELKIAESDEQMSPLSSSVGGLGSTTKRDLYETVMTDFRVHCITLFTAAQKLQHGTS